MITQQYEPIANLQLLVATKNDLETIEVMKCLCPLAEVFITKYSLQNMKGQFFTKFDGNDNP